LYEIGLKPRRSHTRPIFRGPCSVSGRSHKMPGGTPPDYVSRGADNTFHGPRTTARDNAPRRAGISPHIMARDYVRGLSRIVRLCSRIISDRCAYQLARVADRGPRATDRGPGTAHQVFILTLTQRAWDEPDRGPRATNQAPDRTDHGPRVSCALQLQRITHHGPAGGDQGAGTAARFRKKPPRTAVDGVDVRQANGGGACTVKYKKIPAAFAKAAQ